MVPLHALTYVEGAAKLAKSFQGRVVVDYKKNAHTGE
jgi:hypothetical protein